jgi:hypothetical protein
MSSGQACSVEMLAPEGEQGRAEPVSDGEGHGGCEEAENAAPKNFPAWGGRDVVKAGDGTGEVSRGQWPTSPVTARGGRGWKPG